MRTEKKLYQYQFCLWFSSSAFSTLKGKRVMNINYRRNIRIAIGIRSFGGSKAGNKGTLMLILKFDATATLLSIFINI